MTLAVAWPNWVGDVVMATPTLRALRARFPDERIVAVVRPYVRPVLDPNPWTDDYLECGASAADFRRAVFELRRRRVETGILLPNSFRSALLFWLGGVRRRIGYARGGRSWLLTDRLQAPQSRQASACLPSQGGGRFIPTPMIPYYLALAEALVGAGAADRRMELFVTPADEAAADAAYRAAGLDPAATLLLCPGYAFGPSKGWPVPHWADLASSALERFGLRSAVLCSPSEAPIADAIRRAAPSCATFHDKGITLASARAVVRRARAMVAIDSGLRHYAAALGCPVVALFGPTHIEWTETWYDKEVRLQGIAPCGPCQEPVCPTGTMECMWKITPREVLDALEEALRR
ncbi:MAG TPA: lipopolysaccharide heptosyltransferase II [Phycisphaerae bacterium]|nr:lipopolysaccharide heptosyltransferase II [Phycisphaerae bacterium]